jgi:hypothetical protein
MILSIINGCCIPLEVGFGHKDLFNNPVYESINTIIDIFFIVDVYLNFRTSFLDPVSGEEVTDSKLVALNYLFSF